jgi:hypothetical protein
MRSKRRAKRCRRNYRIQAARGHILTDVASLDEMALLNPKENK